MSATPPEATTDDSPPPSWRASETANPVAVTIVHSADAAAVGKVVSLGPDPVVFGRDAGLPGSVADPELSRVHFRIGSDPRAGCHRLGDAQSRNGTLLDGARVDSALLTPNSVIRAGATVFVYGNPHPLAAIEERVGLVAKSNLPVLLIGETGTGKERLARTVHERSERTGPFVAVNCGAVVRELLAAELFGHTRGAFSGATIARSGLFRAAEGGTLLLDEVGDLPLELQPMLLRTLQEGTVRPLGTDEEVRVDVRVVAATHVSLDEAVERGKFRADLHARLSGAVVTLPPLRERRASILALSRSLAREAGLPELVLTPNAAEALTRHEWPYNVRELVSLLRAFAATRPTEPLDLEYLKTHHAALCEGFRKQESGPQKTSESGPPSPRAALQSLLAQHEGNVSKVADALGKPRSHVYRWLKTFGLDPKRFRGE